MSDEVTVPVVATPKVDTEVNLGIGVDLDMRRVAVDVAIGGHPAGPIKVRLLYTKEEAARIAMHFAQAASALDNVKRDLGVVLPKHARGDAPVLKLPPR